MNNVFLTEEVQVGKSKLLNKVINKINLPVGGYQTYRKIQNTNGNTRTEFLKLNIIPF